VTRASKRLNISQPALSARLGKLRIIFDDALLIPSGRGMIATQRALELQAPLRSALDQLHCPSRAPRGETGHGPRDLCSAGPRRRIAARLDVNSESTISHAPATSFWQIARLR
jgi:DNA-binding transcriptional LysR family regulator